MVYSYLKDSLNGDLKSLLSSHYGLTNADSYRDVIEGSVDSLYIRGNHAYFTLKINQDEEINAFALSRLLNSITFFYQEFCKENDLPADEEFYIKISLQSKGKLALKALQYIGIAGIAGMVILCNNNEVSLEMRGVKLTTKSDGGLRSISDFLDRNQERKIKFAEFEDSMRQLKAMRYDEALKLEEVNRKNAEKKGEQNDSADKSDTKQNPN